MRPLRSLSIYALILGFGFFLSGSAGAQEPVTAIRGVTVVNPGSAPQPDHTILIRADTIAAVGPDGELQIPEEANVIPAEGQYAIPGLIDTHVHFFQSGGLYTRPDIIDLRSRVSYKTERKRIRRRLTDTFRRYLRSGVTAVADVGGPLWNFEVRRKAQHTAKAPLVEVAGPLISTYQPEALATADPPIIRPPSPDSARRLVRQQVRRDTDFIKIWYIVREAEKPADHLPLVRAVIDEAHRHDKPVLVHATEMATARHAVKAGADMLVHSVTDTVVTDSFARLLKENQVIYTPTLTVFERYPAVFHQHIDLTLPEHRWAHPGVISSLFDLAVIPDSILPGFIQSAMQKEKPTTTDPEALKNLKKLYEAGVTIAAGTDAGNIGTPHGPAIYREFELMRKAGLTPSEILVTATINGARFLGRSNELGTIEEGKQADLLLLGNNPLTDIHHIADIQWVIKQGRVFQPEELLDPSSTDIVQKQVNAYNARDLKAFTYFYSDSVRIFNHPKKLRFKGIGQIQDRYGKLFHQQPNLHAEILNRISAGRHVIDRERITGHFGSGPTHAVVHYIVENGKIQQVYFIK